MRQLPGECLFSFAMEKGRVVMGSRKATLIGMLAIVLWSTNAGFLRGVTESLGPVGGSALMYSMSTPMLLVIAGFPKISSFSKSYLLFGSMLFVAYEICASLSLGYAVSRRQAIEVSIVNYLWPSFTVLFSVFFTEKKVSMLIFPGLALSLSGAAWVVGGEGGLDFTGMLLNIQGNPLSYSLAFSGSILWASYCIVSVKAGHGQNGITSSCSRH